MTEYISRQEASDALWQEREMLDSLMDEYLDKGMPIMRSNAKIERNRVDNDIFIIDQLPAASVREARMGKWLPENKRPKSWTFYCSVCYRIAYYPQNHHSDTMPKRCGYAFCPNCGADMSI